MIASPSLPHLPPQGGNNRRERCVNSSFAWPMFRQQGSSQPAWRTFLPLFPFFGLAFCLGGAGLWVELMSENHPKSRRGPIEGPTNKNNKQKQFYFCLLRVHWGLHPSIDQPVVKDCQSGAARIFRSVGLRSCRREEVAAATATPR